MIIKNSLIIGLLLVAGVHNNGFCQIVETQNMSSQGSKNSFVMDIPTMESELAEDVWKKLAKDFKGKTKYNKKIGEYFTDDGTVKGMSNNTVDIYARIQGGKLILWFDLGGAYLNSTDHEERLFAAEDVFSQFEYELNIKLAELEISQKEKDLKSFTAELSKLEKDKLNIQKLKDKALSEVAEQDRNLANNAENQQVQLEKITAQETSIDESKSHIKAIEKKSLTIKKQMISSEN